MAEKNTNRPQSEPEIIPPGKQPDSDVWTSETMRGTHRIYVRRVGPFEIILWVVIIGAILTVSVGLLLGLFLIAIPVVVALIAIGIVSAVVRGYFRPRGQNNPPRRSRPGSGLRYRRAVKRAPASAPKELRRRVEGRRR